MHSLMVSEPRVALMGMHSMLVIPTPIGNRLSAETAATTALLIAGPRPVLLPKERLGAMRVAVELEANVVGEAVSPRPAWSSEAILHGALEIPGHVGAGFLEDLSNPLTRESKVGANARQGLTSLIAAPHFGVALLNTLGR
jgi:hypothetical protein